MVSPVIMGAMAQKERTGSQPYANLKWLHPGFHVNIHSWDLSLTHTGTMTNGETRFAEIPSCSPGFSVGVIGDVYMDPHFNLCLMPSVHFGDKKLEFREQATEEEFATGVHPSYLNFPLDVKYTALRSNNHRPYLTGGICGSVDIGRERGNPVPLKSMDFGFEFGLECDIYPPYFELCPELRFCSGLVNLLERDRLDLVDQTNIEHTDTLSEATSRMVILTFDFE